MDFRKTPSDRQRVSGKKNEIAKQEAEWKRKNKEAGQSETLSAGQQSAIDDAYRLNEDKRQKSKAEVYKEEFAAMQEHLKAYGTYQQQRLAIAEEYGEKYARQRLKAKNSV